MTTKKDLALENEKLKYENRVLRVILRKRSQELRAMEKENHRLQELRATLYMRKSVFTTKEEKQ